MPLPEILYDYALMMLFNDRNENQTRDLSREYLGYIRDQEPTRFESFSNIQTHPLHLPVPFLPVTQAQAMVALATYLGCPSFARDLRAEFPELIPLESDRIRVVSRMIISHYDESSTSDLFERWNRFKNYLQEARAQEAASFRVNLLPPNMRSDMHLVNKTLTAIESNVSSYATSMGVIVPIWSVRHNINTEALAQEVAKQSLPQTINDCCLKISALLNLSLNSTERSLIDLRYATQEIRIALTVKALIIRSAHILFETLRDFHKQTGLMDFRPVFKGRLERLAKFMGIDPEELSPFASSYRSDNQTKLDAAGIDVDSLAQDFLCHCSMNVMDNPVKLPSGHYIELDFLKRLFAGARTAENPYNRAIISREVMRVDDTLKTAIDEFVEAAVKAVAEKSSQMKMKC